MLKIMKNKEIIYITILLLVVVAFRIYLIQMKPVVGVDESIHLRLAQNFVNGKGFLDFDGQTHNTERPLLYTIMAGLFYIVTGNIELADKLVFVLFGVLLCIPVYLITKKLFGNRAGYISLLLVGSSIALTHTIMFSMTHMVMIFFAYLSVWLGLIALQRDDWWIFVLLGISLGLTYLSRYDGLVYFVVMFIFIASVKIFKRTQRKKAILNLVILSLAFFICILPYLLYVHTHTGEWTLSRKVGSKFVSNISENLNKIDTTSSFIALMIKHPVFLFKTLLKNGIENVETFFRFFFSKAVYPHYLAFFSLLGLVFGGWVSSRRIDKLFVIIASLSSFIFIFWLVIRDRFLTPIVPGMIIFAAGGIIFFEEYLVKFVSALKLKPQFFKKPVISYIFRNVITGALIIILFVISYKYFRTSAEAGLLSSMSGFKRDSEFGRELKKRVLPGVNMSIFTQYKYVPFYSEATVKDISLEGKKNLGDFINELHSENVQYLILDCGTDEYSMADRYDWELLKPLFKWETVPVSLRVYLEPFFQKEIYGNRWYRVYRIRDVEKEDVLIEKITNKIKNLYPDIDSKNIIYLGGYSIPKADVFFTNFAKQLNKIYKSNKIKVYNIEKFKNIDDNKTAVFLLWQYGDLTDITEKISELRAYKSLSWDFDDYPNTSWETFQYLSSEGVKEGVWYLKSIGPAPIIFSPPVDIPTTRIYQFEVRMKLSIGEQPDQATLFWITSNDPAWGTNTKWLNIDLIQDNQFHTYTVNLFNHYRFGKKEGDNLTKLRLDLVHRETDIEIDYIKLSLLTPSGMIENIIFGEWARNVKAN